ncbi:MAG: hypothetical protein ACRDRT_07350 [Pseudonocardiaceae bacterium]
MGDSPDLVARRLPDALWLLSDALSEYLDIRRGDDGKLAETFRIGGDRIA